MKDVHAKLTASATPLLLEASTDLNHFAVQRWFFASSFVDDVAEMRNALSRLIGATLVVTREDITVHARRIRRNLIPGESRSQVFVKLAQHLFNVVLQDAELIRLLASSSRVRTWFPPGFLSEAARAAEHERFIQAQA